MPILVQKPEHSPATVKFHRIFALLPSGRLPTLLKRAKPLDLVDRKMRIQGVYSIHIDGFLSEPKPNWL